MLHKRLIYGTGLAALALLVIWLDATLAGRVQPLAPGESATDPLRWLSNGAVSTAALLLMVLILTHELLTFARLRGARPFAPVIYLFTAGLMVGPYITYNLPPDTSFHDESWGMFWLALALAVSFLVQAVADREHNAILNLSATLFIIVLAGGLGGFATKLRMEVGGSRGVLLFLHTIAIVKMTDVGAYFVGRALGRHKLIPWLSPGKTWEGFLGGLAVGMLTSVFLGRALHVSGVPYIPSGPLAYPWGLLVFGLLMALFGTAGDLCASLLKRDAAVKDSGQAIPGMGGMLDVLDSPLLAMPVAWFFWTRIAPLLIPST